MSEKEIVVDNTEDLKFSFFDVSEGGLSIADDEVIDNEEDEKEEEEIVEKVNDPEVETDEEEEEETDDTDEPEKEEEAVEISDVEKTLAELVESGYLLLPEDYEYEDTKEGVSKAFEDSEKFRNQLAFQEAVNFLLSKDGLDMVKVKAVVDDINSIDNLDPEEMEEDDKLKYIKYFYKEIKGVDEDDIDEILESLIETDRVDKELGIAAKQIKKYRQKEIEAETIRVQQQKEQVKKQLEESQKTLKEKLQQDDFNGYEIPKSNKEKVFDMIYKPVKTSNGVTTEFNNKLESVLNDPDKILVLADLLLNMDEKGFKFDNLKREIKNEVVDTTKKKLKALRQSGGKVKVSGGFSKSQSDFDLSKASFFLK